MNFFAVRHLAVVALMTLAIPTAVCADSIGGPIVNHLQIGLAISTAPRWPLANLTLQNYGSQNVLVHFYKVSFEVKDSSGNAVPESNDPCIRWSSGPNYNTAYRAIVGTSVLKSESDIVCYDFSKPGKYFITALATVATGQVIPRGDLGNPLFGEFRPDQPSFELRSETETYVVPPPKQTP
jgi:hypothetical protein